ncbi:histidine phosphatase family protein [Nonomuraea longicatena]|uniref:Histidine phosphatase family protein n=1 Tax=Nonomuraea longicatena TaxID=83682 RepID=A0ABP3Z538_9ACTN
MTGPARIYAVRHGQSEKNLAYQQAGAEPLVYPRGDDEFTLTGRGRQQASDLGRYLAGLPGSEAPELVWCSPYLRALDTWAHALRAWGVEPPPVTVDPRLRDREMGVLSDHNAAAAARWFPEEAQRARRDGEYGFRPSGGESFGDVVDRLRRFMADLAGHADGRRVLIVAHDAIVLLLRHVLAGTPDAHLAAIHAHAPVHNASVSTWHRVNGRLEVHRFNDTAHLTATPT